MVSDAIATRREMVKYQKSYLFSPGKDVNAYVYANEDLHEVADGRHVSPKNYSRKLWIFTICPKKFIFVEIKKEFEIKMDCSKFGLSDGVILKIAPETSARSITLLMLRGKSVTEGNENINYVDEGILTELLQPSFDEAVEATDGQATDGDYLPKLAAKVSETGEFANYKFIVKSIEKIE